ncbi:uncharacterized protein LOC124166765 [Ischnura elegans]|uniref:uncharacterized protein LOC124166765 n=1 Tax=Ischnura elegans TaxID=197161 RepID=UPI001ED88061|nr:uncharacterized protein LOC124166765 [Ischnura elegans]
MMKISTIFIAVAACLSPLQVLSAAQGPEKDLDMIVKNCRSTFAISDEAVSFLHSTGSLKDETDDKAMCYFNCVMEGMGLVKDGAFQVSEQLKVTEKILNGKKKPDGTMYDLVGLKTDIENCSKLQGKNVCHTTYVIVRCIEKKQSDLGITKPNN